MDISDKTISVPMLLVFLIIGIMLGLFLLNAITDGRVLRSIICGILFWIPMGATFNAVTQGCAAIPA